MECDHGFFIAPSLRSRVLKCENSGQWSANMPNCTSMYCNLRIIKGALIYVSYSKHSKQHKSPILQSKPYRLRAACRNNMKNTWVMKIQRA